MCAFFTNFTKIFHNVWSKPAKNHTTNKTRRNRDLLSVISVIGVKILAYSRTACKAPEFGLTITPGNVNYDYNNCVIISINDIITTEATSAFAWRWAAERAWYALPTPPAPRAPAAWRPPRTCATVPRPGTKPIPPALQRNVNTRANA